MTNLPLAGPVGGMGLKVSFPTYLTPFAASYVSGVKEWSINPKTDKKEITAALASGAVAWKKYLSTLKDATISVVLAYMDLTDQGQRNLWDNLMLGLSAVGGGAVEIKLYEDATHGYYCDAFVESFPMSSKIDDAEGSGTTVTLQVSDVDGIQIQTN